MGSLFLVNKTGWTPLHHLVHSQWCVNPSDEELVNIETRMMDVAKNTSYMALFVWINVSHSVPNCQILRRNTTYQSTLAMWLIRQRQFRVLTLILQSHSDNRTFADTLEYISIPVAPPPIQGQLSHWEGALAALLQMDEWSPHGENVGKLLDELQMLSPPILRAMGIWCCDLDIGDPPCIMDNICAYAVRHEKRLPWLRQLGMDLERTMIPFGPDDTVSKQIDECMPTAPLQVLMNEMIRTSRWIHYHHYLLHLPESTQESRMQRLSVQSIARIVWAANAYRYETGEITYRGKYDSQLHSLRKWAIPWLLYAEKTGTCPLIYDMTDNHSLEATERHVRIPPAAYEYRNVVWFIAQDVRHARLNLTIRFVFQWTQVAEFTSRNEKSTSTWQPMGTREAAPTVELYSNPFADTIVVDETVNINDDHDDEEQGNDDDGGAHVCIRADWICECNETDSSTNDSRTITRFARQNKIVDDVHFMTVDMTDTDRLFISVCSHVLKYADVQLYTL